MRQLVRCGVNINANPLYLREPNSQAFA